MTPAELAFRGRDLGQLASSVMVMDIGELSPEDVLIAKEELRDALKTVSGGVEILGLFRDMISQHLAGDSAASETTRSKLSEKLAAFDGSGDGNLGDGNDMTDETLALVDSLLLPAKLVKDLVERKLLALA